jgi:hypothetical protein
MTNKKTEAILRQVAEERIRQDAKWGVLRSHHPFTWLVILGEEVGEANKAALELNYGGSATPADYRSELVQVAAVAVAAIESLDRDQV